MPKRILTGVVSKVGNKTLFVNVVRQFQHVSYKKIVRKSKSYVAHYENCVYNVGDTVSIIESRPLSKTKKWVVC
jgi:small subunit ribosomal protein S17